MITKRIAARRDGGTSARSALRYGEGLKRDRKTGNLLSKSLRTKLGNFGIVDDGIYEGRSPSEMAEIIELAAKEMQATCDMNTRVGADKRIAHFLFSFDQYRPTEAVLRDVEDSMLAALGLSNHHWVSFLHSDNGHFHCHLFVSRIDKIKHLGNHLFQDQTIRDRVAREVELRHGLERHNGMHRIDESGQIVEVPREERRRKQALKTIITDKARSIEIHAGEKTFQTWAEEIRIGDRLKHAKSWMDLHAAAAAYGCEIKQKGAGFIICPVGQKGGIQLSKVGLKNLPAKFGPFQLSKQQQAAPSQEQYKPAPTQAKAESHYAKWRAAKQAFMPARTERINELREAHKTIRQELKNGQRTELKEIRVKAIGAERFAAVSVTKMHHAVQMAELAIQFKHERQALYKDLAELGPGNTFRDYLVREAGKGDNVALGLARKYGMDDATDVSREHEAGSLRIRAAIAGQDYRPTPRLKFTHHIEKSGSVVYHLGRDRQITDSATAKRIQLNDVAAHDPEAISTALRFATLKFGNTLALTGPQEFQKLAVETAVRERLAIKFTDPALEAYRQKLTEEQRLPTRFTINKEKHYASHHRIERLRQTPPAHIRHRMQLVPTGDVVFNADGYDRALRPNVYGGVEQPKQGGYQGVQRAAGSAERTGNDRIRAGGHTFTDPRSSDSGKALPVTVKQPSSNPSVLEWAQEWSKANNKKIVNPVTGAGKVAFEVIYIGQDGIVLDLGRKIAIYPVPDIQGLKVGDKVVVDRNRNMELLQQKSRAKGLGR